MSCIWLVISYVRLGISYIGLTMSCVGIVISYVRLNISHITHIYYLILRAYSCAILIVPYMGFVIYIYIYIIMCSWMLLKHYLTTGFNGSSVPKSEGAFSTVLNQFYYARPQVIPPSSPVLKIAYYSTYLIFSYCRRKELFRYFKSDVLTWASVGRGDFFG